MSLLLYCCHWYTLYRRLDGPHSWSICYGEEKSLLALQGIEPQLLGHPACSLVTILSELSQLHHFFMVLDLKPLYKVVLM
jgi:hypothetical protein